MSDSLSETLSREDRIEASHIAGEMAAARLHELIHRRLEEIEESLGLTQRAIAAELGVSEQQVSRWLAHPRNMTVKSAGRLFFALKSHLTFDCDSFKVAHPHNHHAGVGREPQSSPSAGGTASFTRWTNEGAPQTTSGGAVRAVQQRAARQVPA